MKDSLLVYLRKYHAIQNNILLVNHPTNESYWTDRSFFLNTEPTHKAMPYDETKKYNHRWILNNEIVIEFDNDNWKTNLKNTNAVCERLEKDNIAYTMWHSGNKSYHVHFFITIGSVNDVTTLKKTIMRHYSQETTPDLQLASPNHLIRAEFGVHEKTGNHKQLVRKHGNYPRLSRLPTAVWDAYRLERRRLMAQRLTSNAGSLKDHPGIKYILTTHQFREAEDGRERALFILIHLLKNQYNNKEELTAALQTWYRYSSTKPGFTDREVERKINYHYNRNYTITQRYVEEFLESIGKKELCSVVTSQ